MTDSIERNLKFKKARVQHYAHDGLLCQLDDCRDAKIASNPGANLTDLYINLTDL